MSKSLGKVNVQVDNLIYRDGKISKKSKQSLCNFINNNCSFTKVEEECVDKILKDIKAKCKIEENKFGCYDDKFLLEIDELLDKLAEYIDMKKYKLSFYELQINFYKINRKLYIYDSNILENYSLNRYEIYFIFAMPNKKLENVMLHEFLDGFTSNIYNDFSKFKCCIDKLYKNLISKVNHINVKDGKYTCIVDSSFSGLIAHESIGHFSEYDVYKYFNPNTCIKDKIGSDLVNIIDYAFSNESRDILPCPLKYDDEGNQTKDVSIITNGRFANFLTDEKNSSGIGESTGNSRIGFTKNIKMIRMKNTGFVKGDKKIEDMIHSVKNGYYLITPSSGLSIPKKGFEIKVALGFEIKDGKIGRAIQDLYAFGEFDNFFKSINMVSDNIRWTGAICNKKNEKIFLGMGGPALKCELTLSNKSRFLKGSENR